MPNLQEKPFTRRSLILPIYLPAFLLSLGGGILIPTLPLYAESFGLSLSLIGLVLAMQGAGILITDVPAGILLERIGRKSSMLIGAAVVALSTLGVGLAHTFFELILSQLIAGIGGALWSIARYTYLTDIVPIPERGRSLALFGGISRIGTFLGPTIGGYLGKYYGLRSPFFLCAAIMGLNFFICLFFIVDTKRPAGIDRQQLNLKRFVALLKTHYRALLTAGSGQICVQTLRAGRRIIIPLYASKVIGLDVQAVGVIFSISSFVDMSLFPVAGFIMDRFGRRYATIPCFFIFATGMGMVSFTGSYATLLIAVIVMGFGNGLGSGTMMTLGADLAPREGTGEFLGVWRLIGDSGHTMGPLIVGGIADVGGLAFSAVALSGIGYTAVAIFLWLVPETLRKHKP
ncbi:MAG: MFS transporter [Candidatus Poribacteria bacterium]|nr:MFS transporter [Candidatus Poribacteria bacterium]